MEMIRGDTKPLRFCRKRKVDHSVIKELPDKMFFTVKYNNDCKNFIFQKTLEKGINYNAEDNYYYLIIDSEDTDNLQYRNYTFDIEIIIGKFKATIAKGELKLTSETTHACNENYSSENEELDLEDLAIEEIVTIEESDLIFDYIKSYNKPKINDIELIDNKTSKDLGLQDEMYEISNIEIEELLKGMEW